MRVYVTRPLPGDPLADPPPGIEIETWHDPDHPPPYGELTRRIGEVDGLLCMLSDRIDAPLLRAGHRLRVVSQMAVGLDNVDLAAATELGIPVGHTPGVLVEATADLTWALVLAVARRVPEAETFLRDGRWTSWSLDLMLGMDLHGGTLGVIGLGAIGAAVARRAHGFGMDVVYASRSEKSEPRTRRVELDELLSVSDVVSVNCALTTETRGLIGARELALMKPGSVLVNTARGGIVDEDALLASLHAGHLGGVGLDVFETEPLPADSPLLQAPRCVLVPHIGSATEGTRRRMARLAVDNLLAGLRGEPLPRSANPQVEPR